MSEIRDFRDLKVWRNAIDLVAVVYEVVSALPKTETYALGDQLRRAAVSVPANIAEGQARQHTREFVQFLGVAKGSLAETETLLIVANRLNFIEKDKIHELQTQISQLRRSLQTLINRLKERLPH